MQVMTVDEDDDGSCRIELELGGTGSADMDGGRVWWQLEPGSARWTCSSSIDDRWLPPECRG
ncbi:MULTISPECIES: pilin [unclassified Luteimonas]